MSRFEINPNTLEPYIQEPLRGLNSSLPRQVPFDGPL